MIKLPLAFLINPRRKPLGKSFKQKKRNEVKKKMSKRRKRHNKGKRYKRTHAKLYKFNPRKTHRRNPRSKGLMNLGGGLLSPLTSNLDIALAGVVGFAGNKMILPMLPYFKEQANGSTMQYIGKLIVTLGTSTAVGYFNKRWATGVAIGGLLEIGYTALDQFYLSKQIAQIPTGTAGFVTPEFGDFTRSNVVPMFRGFETNDKFQGKFS